MHCGVVTHVQGSQLLKVEGNLKSRTRGFVCEHGFALREVVHSSERLRWPLVRRGDEFHEVSWAEALAFAAEKLNAVKAKWGAQAFAIQTGWPLVRHPLVNWLHRFARAFGSPNVASVASLCEASLRMGQALTVGTKYSPELRTAKTLVLWGANPPTTAPPFAHLVLQRAHSGRLIVVDPVKTMAAKEATEHLHVRPGTDGALALGLFHLVLAEGTADAAFMREQTVGFEALCALAAQYPPERTSDLTSVPVDQLKRTAKLLAHDGPVGIWQGLGVEHHENGVQTVRAISSLEVLCGRFGRARDPRSEVSPFDGNSGQVLPALYRMRTPEPVPPEPSHRAIGGEVYPLYEMYNREAQGQSYAQAILEDAPYPLRAMMFVASNGLVTSVDSARMLRAAEKLDFLVTVDPFLTFTAQRSDLVLPSTTFAEAPDVADDDSVSTAGLVPAQGEAWPDWKIVFELARALGLGAYFPWQSFHEASAAKHVEWMRSETLQPRVADTGQPAAFGTVSGRVEFESALLKDAGHAALPEWAPPSQTPGDEFPLRLVSGPRPRAYINSQFHQVPSVQARLRRAEALVHPSAAQRFGVEHGATVTVISPLGEVDLLAVVTDDVHPEAVVVPAGFEQANVNRLVGVERRDPVSGFPAFRSGVCRLEVRSTKQPP